MNWRFWKNKEDSGDALKAELLQKEIQSLDDKVTDISEHLAKLTRLQFKTSKNLEEKVDQFQTVFSVQEERDKLLSENQVYDKQHSFMIQSNIRLLDEIDHVSSGLSDQEQKWNDLLRQWARGLLDSLEQVGIYEVGVIGKTFNSQVSESIKAISKDALDKTPSVAYEVIEVINRGFVNQKGQLIRKAQVVTVKEDFNEQ